MDAVQLSGSVLGAFTMGAGSVRDRFVHPAVVEGATL
jgi:hypothetical protein